jgi:transcriptional regulator with XRE-family HTH domain
MREEQGMTPAELACAADIDRAYLEALEAGELTPADDLLAVLAAGFVSNSEVREDEGQSDTTKRRPPSKALSARRWPWRASHSPEARSADNAATARCSTPSGKRGQTD